MCEWMPRLSIRILIPQEFKVHFKTKIELSVWEWQQLKWCTLKRQNRLKQRLAKLYQIKELFEALTDNPLMAMGVIQQLGISPDKLQEIMGVVMTQPNLIQEAVEELGLDFSKVEAAKAKLKEGS